MPDMEEFSGNGILNDRMLASVLNQVNLGVYVTDLKRCIIFWNDEAARITGFKAEQVLGKACHQNVLMHTDRSGNPLCSTTLCPLYRAMGLGRDSDEPVLIYAHRADGNLVPVSVSVSPLKDETGKVVGGIETFRDESVRIQDQTLARAVQRHFLPDKMPEIEGVSLSAEYHPHDLVGGDYYDVRQLKDGRVSLTVMDVTGHGMASALFTTYLSGLVGRYSHLLGSPGPFVTAINSRIADFIGSSRFVTAFSGVLDLKSHQLSWSSAGHPSPVLLDSTGQSASSFEAAGPPLGIVKTQVYQETSTRMQSGDLLLVYTDGASELHDDSGKMLGIAGLNKIAALEHKKGNGNLASRIYQHLLDRCTDIDPPDDITLVALLVE